MQFDNTEMAAVAATTLTEAAPAAPRLDLYATIHKALRAAMFDAVVLAGRTDADDPTDWQRLQARVDALLHFCAQHIVHENRFVHAAVEAHSPGGSQRIAGEHDDHGRAIADLRHGLQHLAQTPVGQRAPAMQGQFDLLVAVHARLLPVSPPVLPPEASRPVQRMSLPNDAAVQQIF